MIITSAEALRAVPVSLREGGYGIGSSRWQVTRQLVLPAARPGILTGTILALARALGETAPLLLAGAVLGTYSTAGTLGDLLTGPYTVLPMTVYDWAAAAPGGVPRAHVRGHHRAAGGHAHLQRPRHPAAQPVSEAVVMDPQATQEPATETPASQETTVTTETKPLTVDLGAALGDGPAAGLSGEEAMSSLPTAISLKDVSVYYGAFRAIKDVTIDIPKQRITAFIGPSGCGKSTLLRSINRMNDLVPTARVEGSMLFHGEDLYAGYVDPVEVRRRIGMVFQKANPFPKSIYDNVAFGPRVNGMKGKMDDIVEESLRRAALWDDVKDKLKQSGMALSGGQQQRLCIARAIATSPDVILMDEPCSALDPRSTLQIEELMTELKQNYTIVIVTHNMQQAARASDFTVFLTMDQDRAGLRRRTRQHARDVHQPQGPADRGLRVRPVRLRREPTMTEQRRRGHRAARWSGRWPRSSRRPRRPARRCARTPCIPRDPRTTATSAEIKDNVLRMGAHGREPDPRGDRCPRDPRPGRGPRGHRQRPPGQRGPAQGDGDDRGHDRDPAARRARPALPAHARSRVVRARAHGRPRGRRSPSRRASSRRTRR